MTITSENNRNNYLGNGAVSQYDYTFRIFEETDILVAVLDDTGDIETDLVLTTDFTVAGVGDRNGGSISLVDNGQDWIDGGNLKTGYTIVIIRNVELTQETDIRNQGDFFPEVHEDEFDKSRMIDQQQQEELDRTFKLSKVVDPSTFDATMPAALAGTPNVTIITNSAGDGLDVGPTADEIANAQGYAQAAEAAQLAAETARDLAEDWAIKTDASVDGVEYSSKEYAQGVQNRGLPGGGSSKDWAIYTTGTVDDTEYSSKYYANESATSALNAATSEANAAQSETNAAGSAAAALVSETNAATSAGNAATSESNAAASASDAAISAGNAATSEANAATSEANAATSEANALTSETNAATSELNAGSSELNAAASESAAAISAANAAAAAAASTWTDVKYKTFADSPISISDTDAGSLYVIDCSGGNVVVNLPEISTLNLASPWSVAFKKAETSSNEITINPFGTETIDGTAASVSVTRAGSGKQIVPDTDPTPDDWSSMEFGEVPIDGAIVGTTDAQTLTAKTFDDEITLQDITTPTNPAAGYKKLYPKADGELYILDSAGSEKQVTNQDPVNASIAALDIDWSSADVFYKDISGNTTFTFSNITDGKTIIVIINNTSGGVVTATFPGSVKVDSNFSGDIAASNESVFTFVSSNSKQYATSVVDMS